MVTKIRQAIDYLEKHVDEPALLHPTLPEEIKAKVRRSQIRINTFTRVGDLYLYLSRFTIEDGLTENLKTHGILKAHNLETYEDVLPAFKTQFADHIHDVTTIDDFIIGERYSSWDISNFARNYENQRGILPIGQDGAHYAVFIKATIGGDKYSNQWLVPQKELKYYFFKMKESYSPEYKNNQSILAHTDLPIYAFVKDGSEYLLSGIFKLKEAVYPPDGKNWFHLQRGDEKASDVVFLESKFRKELEQASTEAETLSIDELKKRLAGTASEVPRKTKTISYQFQRNPYVVAFVRKRANGICEACNAPAPFKRKSDGTPFLEVHHKIQLADGGLDNEQNAIAVCPNCHRALHFG